MMKKSLLIASVFLMGASSMPAQTVGKDPGIFEPATIGGKTYHLISDWAYMNGLKADRHAFGGAHGGFAWATNACRTACIYKYGGKDLVLITDNTNKCCHIFDFETGEYLRDLAYTLDGESFGGVTESNQIGVVIDIENDGITVRNAPEGASIAVYNLDGRIVNGAITESTGTHLSLAPGIYTVKITPDTIAKVLIK